MLRFPKNKLPVLIAHCLAFLKENSILNTGIQAEIIVLNDQ